MTIRIELLNDKLAVKIEKSLNFPLERQMLNKFTEKKPKYQSGPDGDIFSHWEFSPAAILSLMEAWGPDVNLVGEAINLATKSTSLNIKLEDLPFELVPDDPLYKGLDSYQELYVKASDERPALLNASDTGLGKSRASLLRCLRQGYGKVLILSPALLLSNWKTNVLNDLGKHALVYSGAKASRDKLHTRILLAATVITNFEKIEEIKKYKFDHIIIDEAHTVSSDKTKNNRALFSLFRSQPQARKHILTATPLKLQIEDLWGVMRMIDEQWAGTKSAFLDEYRQVTRTTNITKTLKDGREIEMKIPIDWTYKNQEKLLAKLSCVMVRGRKEEILKHEDHIEIVSVLLTPEQKQYYRKAKEGIELEFENGETYSTEHAFQKGTRLLQICEGLFNLDENNKSSGKLDYLIPELKSLKEKAIVWSLYEPVTREIKKALADKCVVYSGQQSTGMKKLAVWAFQGVTNEVDLEEYRKLQKRYKFPLEPGEAQWFTGTHGLKSGMGVNLQSCRLTYFISFHPNPNAIFQARDRVSRKGQIQDTLTRFVVAKETIEYEWLSAILKKHQEMSKFLDSGKRTSFNLNKELIRILRSKE